MTMRISGISSGLDVDSIVKQLMTAKRVPLDKLAQKKQTLQWQRDNYREINSKLVDFKNNKLSKYNNSNQMNTQSAVVSGATAALKAEATPDANGITMDIKIGQLAQAAAQTTSGAIMTDTSTTPATRLTSSSTLAQLQKLNPNATASTDTDSYMITINGTQISLKSSSTISSAISIINNTSNIGVTAKFDEATGKLSITSNTFSSSGKVELDTLDADGKGTDTFQKLFGTTVTPTAYKPAQITVNGGATLEYPSNSFTLNGVKLTLLSKTTDAATVTTTTDATKAIDTIKSFVDTYNELLSSLTTKNTEERYSDYTPLTDAQKEAMSDTDIENWETKAKSGLLKNDSILKAQISSMRSVITAKLGALSDAGITTGQYYENGKLYVNEDKLKAALEANPSKVTSVFQGTDGIFSKLSDKTYESIKNLATKAGTNKYSADANSAFSTDSVMGKALTDYNTRISDLEDKLDNLETAYYKKFTAMETAMSNYSSQSSSLTSMLSS